MLRTPDTISAPVQELCRQINPHAAPIFLTIKADPGCVPNDCFDCVRRKIAREGGRIQFGWCIWEWPRVFIEAEHHAVYEPPTGPPWLDISPAAQPPATRRLFLSDDAATYAIENEDTRRDNVRRALTDDPLVQEFFRLAEERNAILNAIPGVGKVTLQGEAATRFQRNHQRAAEIEFQLALKNSPQGAPCPCGSGLKFKRCHGQPSRPMKEE